MAFRDQTLDSFLNSLSSKAPVPGGGGASALVGALSAALAQMVASLTVGKPKYAAVESEMNALLQRSEALTNRFLALMDEDATAFEPLAQAYRLPKGTDEEIAEKARVMEQALKSAVQPPLEIMETCIQTLPLILACAERGSVVAVSDAGVAASLCRAALESAGLNVFINTKTMQDRVYADNLNQQANAFLAEGCAAADAIYRQVALKVGV
ncbi:Methenyltetrahydrofolate cyclohydrolase [bioreactor metagenome]|uniref:Methenyltetrahydrofolate cyclohydrolase n=1 Tax=bioreactor metagenome TaxID=1076179 RepID=A0A645C5B2_9ZZZZ|nr:cyclodeaminase/cyclohydrolase family protein [Christensenella sp.]